MGSTPQLKVQGCQVVYKEVRKAQLYDGACKNYTLNMAQKLHFKYDTKIKLWRKINPFNTNEKKARKGIFESHNW